MQSSNPVLRNEVFTGYGRYAQADTMTSQGVVYKTAILLLLVILSSSFTWMKFVQGGGNASLVSGWMMLGLIGGFITAMATAFKPTWAPVSAPIYALLEGLFIGGLSATFEAQFPGIVIQATMLTFGTLLAMLAAYQSGMIQATENFKLGVVAATGGIAIFYLVAIVLGFFGVNIPFITGGGTIGIAFSVIVVIIAALNFVIDFDFIEQGAKKGLPKYMEWYGAFALMVTLVWLYMEILRLLSKMRESK
jgi:uncharacterized YccA/Bax inhibitor family protein